MSTIVPNKVIKNFQIIIIFLRSILVLLNVYLRAMVLNLFILAYQVQCTQFEHFYLPTT